MAIILTLINNLILFVGVELYVLMGWGSDANVVLIGLPILYIALVVFSVIKKDIILNHLVIANLVMVVVLLLVIAIGASKYTI